MLKDGYQFFWVTGVENVNFFPSVPNPPGNCPPPLYPLTGLSGLSFLKEMCVDKVVLRKGGKVCAKGVRCAWKSAFQYSCCPVGTFFRQLAGWLDPERILLPCRQALQCPNRHTYTSKFAFPDCRPPQHARGQCKPTLGYEHYDLNHVQGHPS